MNYINKKRLFIDNNPSLDNDIRLQLEKEILYDYKKPKKNNDSCFVGYDEMKRLMYHQLDLFRKFKENEDWESFHKNHYDWWTFPIPEVSGHGYKYTVFEDDINELFKDCKYVNSLKECAKLVCEAWGWDIYERKEIEKKSNDQKWSYWPIRLYKIVLCLESFCLSEAKGARILGEILIKKGHNFTFNGRNLEYIFTHLCS